MGSEESYVLGKINDAIEAARAYRGNEIATKARYAAITIMEMEKALAIFTMFVVNETQGDLREA